MTTPNPTAATAPLTPEREAEARELAGRADDDPFFLSDCEGELQVWRESALTHVRRDNNGQIDMYSFPSSYRSTDQVIEIDLDSWDPGEDQADDQRRQDIGDLVTARSIVRDLLTELDQARAERDRYHWAWHNARDQAASERAHVALVETERDALKEQLLTAQGNVAQEALHADQGPVR